MEGMQGVMFAVGFWSMIETFPRSILERVMGVV
jgi:hypothetical protein